jgi:flagella basal body P-ring formation protein FlgA
MSTPRTLNPVAPLSVRVRGVMRILSVCALWSFGVAWAQTPVDPDYESQALQWLTDAVQANQSASAENLRMEVSVGSIDRRLKLAPCGNVEAYLPPGARYWGRTRVGLRCIDGMARWNISIPATVKAMGDAWVLKSHVAPGSIVTEADVVEASVDWAENFQPVLRDRTTWVGQTATRQLTTGQTLRQGMVKPAQVFQAGTQVRVVAQGAGFQVSSDAQALSAGVVGQSARVKMDNGRVASGTVLNARTVRIDL